MRGAEASIEDRETAVILADVIVLGREAECATEISRISTVAQRAWLICKLRPERNRRSSLQVNGRCWEIGYGFGFRRQFSSGWPGTRERDCICLFCGNSVNTLGSRDHERQIPAAFLKGIQKHTEPCAVMWLATLHMTGRSK